MSSEHQSVLPWSFYHACIILNNFSKQTIEEEKDKEKEKKKIKKPTINPVYEPHLLL